MAKLLYATFKELALALVFSAKTSTIGDHKRKWVDLNCGRKKGWGYILIVAQGLLLTLASQLLGNQNAGGPPRAQEVSGHVQMYDEVLTACSPDGHWLDFEYHELSDPDYPHVGIMDLTKESHPWRPLLKGKLGRHLLAGDIASPLTVNGLRCLQIILKARRPFDPTRTSKWSK